MIWNPPSSRIWLPEITPPSSAVWAARPAWLSSKPIICNSVRAVAARWCAAMRNVRGLHHVTAIAGPAQENLDFYAGVLGMRLVKKSVNQDDPGTYHLFYADAEGHPGTDLTFFPWTHLAPPRIGHGLAVEVSLEVPDDSLAYWGGRLEKYGAQLQAIDTRFGDRVLALEDPHGLRIALVQSAGRPRRRFTASDR